MKVIIPNIGLFLLLVIGFMVIIFSIISINRSPSKGKVADVEATTTQPPDYKTCSQLYNIGKHDLSGEDPYYKPNLDRDHDNVACET